MLNLAPATSASIIDFDSSSRIACPIRSWFDQHSSQLRSQPVSSPPLFPPASGHSDAPSQAPPTSTPDFFRCPVASCHVDPANAAAAAANRDEPNHDPDDDLGILNSIPKSLSRQWHLEFEFGTMNTRVCHIVFLPLCIVFDIRDAYHRGVVDALGTRVE
jgi:hypothetical protein